MIVPPACVLPAASDRAAPPAPVRLEVGLRNGVTGVEFSTSAGVFMLERVGDSPEFAFRIGRRANLPVGVYRETVPLVPVTSTGERLPPVRVELSAEVLPDVEPVPRPVLLGLRKVGEVATDEVRLRSLTGTPFTVESVSAEGDGVSVVADGEAYRIEVRVPRAGPIEAAVRWVVRQDGRPAYTIRLPVQVQGFDPK